MADDAADGSEGNSFPMHLRTVHSALVIACLAILIAATSYHERALDTAVDDIDRITGLFPIVADGQWHFIAMTFDGKSAQLLYGTGRYQTNVTAANPVGEM